MPSANNLGPDGGVLGPNGGKPKGKTGQASDNSSEKGKPNQKTKAVAKLVPGPDNQPILVLDGDRPDREELRTVCDYFGMQPEYVMSNADYEKAYGPVDMTPGLPQLSTAETVAALQAVPLLGERFTNRIGRPKCPRATPSRRLLRWCPSKGH